MPLLYLMSPLKLLHVEATPGGVIWSVVNSTLISCGFQKLEGMFYSNIPIESDLNSQNPKMYQHCNNRMLTFGDQSLTDFSI